VFPDQRSSRPDLAVIQAIILRRYDLRFKPGLCFPVRAIDVHVQTRFLAREEKEPESVLAKDIRAQGLFFQHLNGAKLVMVHSLLNSLEQVFRASQSSANRSPPREQHRHNLLVVTISFTELGDNVFLLKVRTKNDPEAPKYVKEQAV
jgi:hypothetical protein